MGVRVPGLMPMALVVEDAGLRKVETRPYSPARKSAVGYCQVSCAVSQYVLQGSR